MAMSYQSDVNKISNYFSCLESKKPKIKLMFSYFRKKNISWVVLGGTIRHCLENKKTRDIDIVLSGCKNSDLISYLSTNEISYIRNSFGGYKFVLDKTQFDIWTMDNHYLFKVGIYKKCVENLQYTTFLSYDSLVYDGLTRHLFSDGYTNCEKKKIIDFVGSKKAVECNPVPAISICKIYKLVFNSNYAISENVKNYIIQYRRKFNSSIDCIKCLEMAYKKHYKKEMSQSFKIKLKREIEKIYCNSFQLYLPF